MLGFENVASEIRIDSEYIKNRFLSEAAGDNVIIFGAGDCGHKIYDLLMRCDVRVRCFCDNGMAGSTDEATGLSIISPQELHDTIENPKILLCIADDNVCSSVFAQLSSFGFDSSQIRNMKEYFYWKTGDYFEIHMENYRKGYQLLDDEFSRRVYLEKMKKVFLLRSIADIVSPGEEEYFDEKVVLTDDEVFVDCGGFDGDTAKRFAEKCGGRYRNILIFEPESCKKEAIQKNMEDNPYELYPFGVWSKKTKLYFKALGTVSSHISENGQGDMIETVSLDEVIYSKRPTFIKMDIEGAEQEALRGCRKIIQTYKPKLAVCVYHKPEDLYEIPMLIKELNPAYRLYMRQYVDSWYDTVLYAV